MSDKGREFVERWVADNVVADAQREVEERDPEGDDLTEQCLAAAAEQDITRDDIEDEVGYLPRYMVHALRDKAEAERQRLRGRED
ncbi:hypothetical protein [Muricoccus radiodurans]|uniref:DUF768 domain-containing protein n=1 Tax=Muricoccus radiodurans TaxID=2231721 RepID=UPI003CF040BA